MLHFRPVDLSDLARSVSLIESDPDSARTLMSKVLPKVGRAHLIGITGPPGAGKSTLTSGLIREFRKRGDKVAVLAVDPSSPFTGGAVLGDRVRMTEHSSDPNVFIRSLGTRGRGGGLSYATQRVAFLLDAAGFDRILIETAGVGQTELEISRLAQSVVVVLVPESGDEIQVLKAGILEIAHLFCLNKSDRPGADLLFRELVESFHGKAQVLKTVATTGTGLTELASALDVEREKVHSTEGMEKWRERVLTDEVRAHLAELLEERFQKFRKTPTGGKLVEKIVAGKASPYSVGKVLLGK